MTTILSKDIQSLVPADKIDNHYIIQRKILWGPPGTENDVSLLTPFPVQGTFTFGAGFSSFGQGTPTQISVGISSTQLLAANSSRKFARIVNNSSGKIYIQYGISAVWGQGVPMNTNAVLTIDLNELWLGTINAITNGTSLLIDVMEGV